MILNIFLSTTLIFGLSYLVRSSGASSGDQSYAYANCLDRCLAKVCKNDKDFKESPPRYLKLFFWTCREDCSYNCMWDTVQFFTSHGLQVPQFHGKWPFIRFLGIQEPASVVFSILNFCAHLKYYVRFKRETNYLSPMFFVWSWFTLICLHGWFWSAVFHTRDNSITEAMDYSCAFSIVLTLFYCLLLRITCEDKISAKVFIVITSLYLSLLYTHLIHLWSGQINYGYNMQLNIAIGFLTLAISMIWWFKNHRKLRHIHLIGWFLIFTVLAATLEFADFPPIFWIFDAHSLWHAATIPVVKLLYEFASKDCSYIKRQYVRLRRD